MDGLEFIELALGIIRGKLHYIGPPRTSNLFIDPEECAELPSVQCILLEVRRVFC